MSGVSLLYNFYAHKSFVITRFDSSALEVVLIRKFRVNASLEPSEYLYSIMDRLLNYVHRLLALQISCG